MKHSIQFFIGNLIFLSTLATPQLPRDIKDLCERFPLATASFMTALDKLINIEQDKYPATYSTFFHQFCTSIYPEFNKSTLFLPAAEAQGLLSRILRCNRLHAPLQTEEQKPKRSELPRKLPPLAPTLLTQQAPSEIPPSVVTSLRLLQQALVPRPLPEPASTPESLKVTAYDIAAKFELLENLSFPATTFDHIVGGVPEEIKIIQRLMMGDPFFKRVGARKPAGTLLYGPPGTGKTLLAKAIAGEINKQKLTPFIYIAGSAFINKYVGIGAAKIRKIFELAIALVAHFPYTIIFIDELDAMGGKRDGGEDGGSRESASTIAQLMTCLDGQDTVAKEKVIVLAATNLDHVLDAGLMRTKRFDNKIIIPLPDKDKRAAILEYYLFKTVRRSMEKDINTDLVHELAKKTDTFNCADLDTLVNEAALTAGYDRRNIEARDLLHALEKIKASKPRSAASEPPEQMYG